jgi:hypothetical protein
MSSLRQSGQLIDLSPHLEEYFRCANDIIYFAENYFHIVSIDEGKHKIKLFDYQKKALKIFTQKKYKGKQNCIVLFPRQMGKCFFSETQLDIRNKKSGEIIRVTPEELYNIYNCETNRKTV